MKEIRADIKQVEEKLGADMKEVRAGVKQVEEK
jgi:hypothetical protein